MRQRWASAAPRSSRRLRCNGSCSLVAAGRNSGDGRRYAAAQSREHGMERAHEVPPPVYRSETTTVQAGHEPAGAPRPAHRGGSAGSRGSLRMRLTGIAMLTCLASLLLAMTASVVHDVSAQRRRRQLELQMLAQLAADNVAPALVFADATGARDVLRALQRVPFVRAARVRDAEGRTLAQWRSTTPRPAGATGVRLRQPIVVDHETVGELRLFGTLPSVRATLEHVLPTTFAIWVFATAFALLVARRLFRPIARQLGELMRVTARVADHADYEIRAEAFETGGELARFTERLNQMIAAIGRVVAQLRASESFNRVVLETVPEGVVTVDARGRVAAHNHAFARTVDEAQRPQLGRPIAQILAPDELARLFDVEHDGPRTSEGVALRGDRRVPVEVTTAAITLGADAYVVGVVRDLTEQKAAQARVAQLHEQLLHASREAGMAEVAIEVLHNIGNVLNSVGISARAVAHRVRASRLSSLRRLVELLREHRDDLAAFLASERGALVLPFLERALEALEHEQRQILDETERMRQHLDRIEQIVHEQNRHVTHVTVQAPCRPDRLTQAVLSRLSRQLATLEVVAGDCPETPVLLDRHKTERLLGSVLRYAAAALEAVGAASRRVALEVVREDDALCWCVTLPCAPACAAVREAFVQRCDAAASPATGLLHDAYYEAVAMGGRLEIEAAGADTTRVVLRLPVRAEPATPPHGDATGHADRARSEPVAGAGREHRAAARPIRDSDTPRPAA
ncbi:MAG: PAS domain S-box protein [Planctomycetota bacterium]|nr:MAG: PAS domain S-box protein [Planctomycetota bacterium]